MDTLPAELVELVEDSFVSGTTFSEFVADTRAFAGLVCRREALFARWLRKQPGGRPLVPFAGSQEELAFMREHITGKHDMRMAVSYSNRKTVLVEQRVSLTCNLEASGSQWWLTRESGRVPANYEGGVPCMEGIELAKAYVLVRVVRPLCMRKQQIADVGISDMCAPSLDWVVEGIAPYVQPLVLDRVDGHVECTSTEECPTAYHARRQFWIQCSFSGGVRGTSQWLLRDRFNGVFPSGRGHWWRGVTDAADESSGFAQSGLWLHGGSSAK